MNRKATFVVMLCFYFVIGCAAIYIYHFNKSALENAPVITRITAADTDTVSTVPTVTKLEAPVEEEKDEPVEELPVFDIDTEDSSEQLDGLRTPEELFGDVESSNEPVPVTSEEYVFKAIHTSGRLFIRKEPSTDSEQLGFLIYGQTGEVLENLGDWAKVDYKGTIGYVSTEYLELTPLSEVSTESLQPEIVNASEDNNANNENATNE